MASPSCQPTGDAMEKSTDLKGTAAGLAALGICESLLLALTDLKIVSDQDARGLLTDVVTTHNEAADTSETPEKHQAVVEVVRRILAGMKLGGGLTAHGY